MNSPFKNIKFIFLAVVLLPTLIFSIYEIGSFRENERVIDSIYGNQLDAILYSVNQYSEDIISGWANQIEDLSNEHLSTNNQAIAKFIENSQAIELIYIYNNNNKEVLYTYPTLSDTIISSQEIDSLLTANEKNSQQLTRYLEEGYRKLEPLHLQNNNAQLLMFSIQNKSEYINVLLSINQEKFIHDVLDPKIQEITQDKFYIGAFYQTVENLIYSSDKQYQPNKFKYEKAFWLLNNYHLAIELKDQTINELVKSRSRKNLFLIVIIDFVLIFGAILIYRNIHKQMELARIKSDFISNVSHEIRTPLALISMYIETLDLNRVKTEEKRKEYYSIINQETQRLANMVNNILNFSKIENNKREYTFSNTNINEIVNDVVNTFNYQLEKNSFNLTLDLDAELQTIQADKDAVTEALINLIDNAIKYSNGNKSISIRTSTEKESVFVEVADKGIGIPESEQKRIFDKFYRVTEKNLAHRAKGSGLGLAIVKHVMNAHNGKITVKSKFEQGSIFRLTFPINNQNYE